MVNEKREEDFIKDLNELVKKHGLTIQYSQGESFIYDYVKGEDGSYVHFSTIEDVYLKRQLKFIKVVKYV